MSTVFELADRLAELYVSYRKMFVISTPPTKTSPEGCIFVPKDKNGNPALLKQSALVGHLNHRFAVCVYAGGHSSKFMCFDVDSGGVNAVHKIIDALADLGIPRDRVYVSRSGGKGYHVEMFFSELVYTDRLQILYDEVIRRTGLNPQKVEFRPTSKQSIKLPLSVHRKSGNVCWFCEVTMTGGLLTIMDPEYLMKIQRLPADDVRAIIDRLAAMDVEREPRPQSWEGYSLFADLTDYGQRHEILLKGAVHERYLGSDSATARQHLLAWWNRQDKTLSATCEEEVEKDIDGIVGWVYSDKFHQREVTPPNSITFDAGDMRLILSQPTKTRRKLMFLTIRGSKRYSCMCATQEQLAEVCGVGKIAICNAFKEMAADGWVKIIKQRTKKTSSGNMVARPNKYVVTYEAEAWARPPHAPFEHGDDKILQTRLRRDTLVVNDEVERNPMEDYHRVLKEFLSEKDMKKFLTAKELEELENGNKDYEGTHRGDQVGQQQVPDGLSAEHGREQRQGEVQEHPADLCA